VGREFESLRAHHSHTAPLIYFFHCKETHAPSTFGAEAASISSRFVFSARINVHGSLNREVVT
jgi:hypothetical protein